MLRASFAFRDRQPEAEVGEMELSTQHAWGIREIGFVGKFAV